mmetsp:Transcript_71082/g.179900  ORF Transcript_71082/g.179900 Transcript_71082/m.179900 type:complete len:248 (+) Transcript_71082:796-1539(+)
MSLGWAAPTRAGRSNRQACVQTSETLGAGASRSCHSSMKMSNSSSACLPPEGKPPGAEACSCSCSSPRSWAAAAEAASRTICKAAPRHSAFRLSSGSKKSSEIRRTSTWNVSTRHWVNLRSAANKKNNISKFCSPMSGDGRRDLVPATAGGNSRAFSRNSGENASLFCATALTTPAAKSAWASSAPASARAKAPWNCSGASWGMAQSKYSGTLWCKRAAANGSTRTGQRKVSSTCLKRNRATLGSSL